ncbi:tRNA (guanosine(37)-N1)-methyltransferase TrmD [Terrabacter sp. NPDC080008]|uniref:tRNA (guanosine(37)-N1)-methyltransferase TrmD n=1 Tax=Terrabacter sp. NPDC080008 TaxID=3155176 RepID=UPI00344D728B
MRVDVVSIFPDYLAPLDLSLIGKAREDGLLDVRVHDLRDFTHDRHRTVDDTPYGGGAGMVMKPQPWAEALDHVLALDNPSGAKPHLVVPGPGGQPFSQALARRLALEPWLAFACGRYEGIDERVYEHARDDLGLEVSVVSLGDYVLNGGEVAVLAMVEAIGRLVPGVIGNAESLVEESHEDGLLEYPIYTKPSSWNGRDVPAVLLSGNHGAIAAWRHEQRLARTAARRPDLLHASHATGPDGVPVDITAATRGDVPELAVLLRACAAEEAVATGSLDVPALHEGLDEVSSALETSQTWLARSAGRLVGAVRTRRSPDAGDRWEISRLCVTPDLDGSGLDRQLLDHAEDTAPDGIRTLTLEVGAHRTDALKAYRKAGYRPADTPASRPGTVVLAKRRR